DETAVQSNALRWNWSHRDAASTGAAERTGEPTEPIREVGRTAANADVVELRVSDDGPGVPSEERAVLSGEREIDPLHHTGGLGLWLTDWIVSQAGGTVDIACDEGTTVIVRIPAATASDDAE
ncbi:ATP-binding protein, partial [Natronoarchaeum mannanilyticum]